MNLLDRLLGKQNELASELVKVKTEEGKKPKEPDVEEKEPDLNLIKTLTEEQSLVTEDDVVKFVQDNARYVKVMGKDLYKVQYGGKLYSSDDTRDLVVQICRSKDITCEGKKPKEPDIEEKEPDLNLIKTLTEEEKKFDITKSIEEEPEECDNCGGSGKVGHLTCKQCQGTGDAREGKKPKEPDVAEKEPGTAEIKKLTEEEKHPSGEGDVLGMITRIVTSHIEGAGRNLTDDDVANMVEKLLVSYKDEILNKIMRDVRHRTVKREPDREHSYESKKLTEQPEDFSNVRDDKAAAMDDEEEEFTDEPGFGEEDDVEPEAAIEESPFPEKEYFGQDEEKELHYYLVGVKSDEDTREDVQIQDQEENMIWSAKEKGVDISDVANTIIEITKELEVDVNYDVFMKYMLPKIEEEPEMEEFEEEENFGEEEPEEERGYDRGEKKETPFEGKKVSEKSPPTCSKCNKAHWPFQKCDSGSDNDSKEEKEDEKESIMKTNITFNEQKFDVSSIDNNTIIINGRKYPLSEDTLKFYHLNEEEDLKCLANDMVRAMSPEEIRRLTEKTSKVVCKDCGETFEAYGEETLCHICRDRRTRGLTKRGKESIMKTKTDKKTDKKVNEDLASDVKQLQTDATSAIKEGDYMAAADIVQRLAAAQSAIGAVSEDEAPVDEPELEAEAEVEPEEEDKAMESEPEMEEKVEEKPDEEKEVVEEEKIEEMTVQEAEEFLKTNGLSRNDDTTDEQVIEGAKNLKSVMDILLAGKEASMNLENFKKIGKSIKEDEAEEKVDEKEEEEAVEETDVVVGLEEKTIMKDIFDSTRPIKEKVETVEEDR